MISNDIEVWATSVACSSLSLTLGQNEFLANRSNLK
jgi:hypothetical protein